MNAMKAMMIVAVAMLVGCTTVQDRSGVYHGPSIGAKERVRYADPTKPVDKSRIDLEAVLRDPTVGAIMTSEASEEDKLKAIVEVAETRYGWWGGGQTTGFGQRTALLVNYSTQPVQLQIGGGVSIPIMAKDWQEIPLPVYSGQTPVTVTRHDGTSTKLQWEIDAVRNCDIINPGGGDALIAWSAIMVNNTSVSTRP